MRNVRRVEVNGVNGRARPLFRWAGGKQRVASALSTFLPLDIDRYEYIEPFLGAGSLFFRIHPRRALLGDLNGQLMRAYRYIRDMPIQVKGHLYHHERSDSVAHYYRVREQYNRSSWNAAQAARFVYLNRTCFNGIFRVNKQGSFNVPYGYKRSAIFPTRSEILDASLVLRNTKLRHQRFQMTLKGISKSSFVYLDPPYPPLNGTAYFTHYTQDRFTEGDQRELANSVLALHRAGALFMMSNADTSLIRRLYRGFRTDPLSVTRFVTCKSRRHQVRELVIRNY